MRVHRIAHHGVVSAWRERERALIAAGHDVTLLSAREWDEGGQRVSLDAGQDDFVVGARTWGTHPNGFLYSPAALSRFVRSARDSDVLDVHEEPYSLAMVQVLALRRLRGNRRPYVVYSAQNIDKRFPWPIRWAERHALRGAAGAYTCNVEAARILRRKGLRGPVRVIPLGVDSAIFSASEPERSEPASTPVVGYVGRLAPHKGVDVLLHAIAEREGLRAVIVGEGPQRGALEELARRLGIAGRVTFAGFAEDTALAQHYRSFDVLAVPSLPRENWLEQFGRVAVEAMASGVPVVASRTGALPDVVASAGILVPPGDPEALASALDEALVPERWRALREAGASRARECEWPVVAAAMDELYSAATGAEERHLDAIVVAYGEPDGLEAALAALDGAVPVTVVDNSSDPRTRALCAQHGVTYLDPGANVGFAAGVNHGLADLARRDRHGDVLLLNPDAAITPDGVAQMHQALVRDRNLAAVGARQVDPATGEEARVWWPFPTPWGAIVEAAGLGRLRRAHGFAIGSVLLLRREALDALGRLDERFFLYAEEVDWQRRARRAGWRIDVAQVEATHVGAGTGGDPGVREAHFYGSAERYIRKHFGGGGWQVYRAATLAGAAVRGVLLPGERGASAVRRRRIFATGPVAWEQSWR